MPDTPSFDTFVLSASPRLCRAARLLVHDPYEAEDLTQEALIRVFRAWWRIREPDAAHAYAYRTLIRLTHRHLRKGRTTREVPVAAVTDGADSGSDTANGLQDIVRAELARLPHRQKETLILRYFLDLSVEQTSRAMRCSTGTVKSQTSKGLASLRQAILDPELSPSQSSQGVDARERR